MWTYWLKQQRQLARAHIDRFLGAPKLKRRFGKRHGYPLNLENPQTFSEKIQWRKLYDKNPIFPILSNKYLVRKYIADRLGNDRAREFLVPLLQYSEDPNAIDFAALPAQFVLKATHGSGMNLIVEDATTLDHRATRALMRKWLMTHYKVRDHEWIYTKTPRGILAEKRVAPPDQLVDVSLQYFNGKMRVFIVLEHRGGTKFSTRFDAEAAQLDDRFQKAKNPDAVPPAGLEEMIDLGEILSHGLDHLRVDFLCTPERFYLGELTLMPGSGLLKDTVQDYDREIGRFWTIPAMETDLQAGRPRTPGTSNAQ